MNNEINDLHKQIKTLLNEKVGGNGNDPNRASPSRMPASERKPATNGARRPSEPAEISITIFRRIRSVLPAPGVAIIGFGDCLVASW